MLAQGGKQHEVAEEVFANLFHEKELLALALTFASLIFDDEVVDKPWLERRVSMLDDIIRDTWFYQKIWKEGNADGIKKGMEKRIERGIGRDV